MAELIHLDKDGKVYSTLGTLDAADVPYTPTTAADWPGDADPGNVDGGLDALAARTEYSGAEVYNSANVSLANTAYTQITFDSETFDTDSYHDAGAPSRLTAPAAGKYLIEFNGYTASANGEFRFAFYKNGGVISLSWQYWNGSHGITMSKQVDLNASDYVEVYIYQNTGGSVNLIGGVATSPYFSIVRVGDQT